MIKSNKKQITVCEIFQRELEIIAFKNYDQDHQYLIVDLLLPEKHHDVEKVYFEITDESIYLLTKSRPFEFRMDDTVEVQQYVDPPKFDELFEYIEKYNMDFRNVESLDVKDSIKVTNYRKKEWEEFDTKYYYLNLVHGAPLLNHDEQQINVRSHETLQEVLIRI